jgi:DMSO/TMAO reductase YedYZ molybdopterin-dependent catalytic subunit
MKRYYSFIFLALFAFMASPAISIAQNSQKEPSIKVTGEVTTAIDLKMDDLQKLPQTEVTRKDKDGKDHIYKGVVLSTILTIAGVTLGKELRGRNLIKYALVEASDGYQVVFALAELDKDFTDRNIILATQTDGQPLVPADGPFRIIVQDEKRPARCIKQVVGIKILFAN